MILARLASCPNHVASDVCQPGTIQRSRRRCFALRGAASGSFAPPPELLGDDELARAIDSLRRKLASARRMLVIANFARLTFLLTVLAGGFAILWAGPAPFLELI